MKVVFHKKLHKVDVLTVVVVKLNVFAKVNVVVMVDIVTRVDIGLVVDGIYLAVV